MKASTSDIGLLIRDMLEGDRMSVFKGEDEHANARRIDFVDVSDAHNPVIHLDNGQTFVVRVFAQS